MSDLKELEEKSIFTIREAQARFKNLAALWSTGKDSTVLVALARKAFFGRVPFPLIHIDNGIDFPETYEFRERLSKEWGLEVLVPKSIIKDDLSGVRCCGSNKTDALKRLMEERHFDGLFVSIRRDEHGIRGKERYFSPRDKEFKWDYKNQAPEIWDYISQTDDASHIRIHPLLHWTELDMWLYIKQEGIPVNPLYFAHNGMRYRSLGCTQCTVGIESQASTVDEIIEELKTTTTSERAGRMQDKEQENVMQRLRALGYM
ncbi:MAG: sulfate adenylyltransferase subunit CysD [Nitrospirae bacterium]|nr:sulfate adenylyltransferase subunit CysD [Nitrospirota bacterium]